MDGFTVRELKLMELKEGIELIDKVFKEFQGTEYSIEGINEFEKFIEINNLTALVKSKMIKLFCCIYEKKIIGVIALRDEKHISLFFVDKVFQRMGIGKSLLNKVLDYLNKSNKKLCYITVNAATSSIEAYKKMRFTLESNELNVNGIKFVKMKYEIRK